MIEIITYQPPQEQLRTQVLSDFLATLGDDKAFSTKQLHDAGEAFASGLPALVLGRTTEQTPPAVDPLTSVKEPNAEDNLVATDAPDKASAAAAISSDQGNVVSLDEFKKNGSKESRVKVRNAGIFALKVAGFALFFTVASNLKSGGTDSTPARGEPAAEAISPITEVATTLSTPEETEVTVVTPTSTATTVAPVTTAPAEPTVPVTTEAPTTTVDPHAELAAERGQLVGSASIPDLCETSIGVYVQNEVFNTPDQVDWTSAEKAQYRRDNGDPRDILIPNTPENCPDLKQYAKAEQADNPRYLSRHQAGNDKYMPIMVLDIGGVAPGNVGNVVLGGHNTASSAPTRDLYKLQAGNVMELTYKGVTHYYQVVAKGIVATTGDTDQDNRNYTSEIRNFKYAYDDGTSASNTLVLTGCGTNGIRNEETGEITVAGDALYVAFVEINPYTWMPL